MADQQEPVEASQEMTEEAQALWAHFTSATKYVTIITVIVLILMAIFLL